MRKFKTFKLNEGEKVLYDNLRKDVELEDIPSPILRILFNRGIRTKEEIMYNLLATTDNLIDIPMKDMSYFSDRLLRCFSTQEKIVVMGDYDTDGTMATVIMVRGLRRLGLDVDYYMNSRFVDGYGLKSQSVDEIRKLYPDVSVIITVDNGIKSFEAVDYCNKLGVDVLITDHHEPSSNGMIPNAYAVVDPKQVDCMYPFKELCGAGVAYKCLRYLYKQHLGEDNYENDYLNSLLWIVGIATVGDQVPLVSENRIIVRQALTTLNHPSNGIYFTNKLKEVLKIDAFKSDTIGYYISPMINAMGRVHGNPLQVVEALLSYDEQFIDSVIEQIVKLNEVRREMTSEQTEIALGLVKEKTDNKCLVVASEKFTEGIVGLVAGRLTEKYHKPVLAMCIDEEGLMKGSARSIEGINIVKALDSIAHLLTSYGGHEMAAGFSLDFDNLEELEEQLNSYMEQFEEEVFVDNVMIDLVLSESQINTDVCKMIDYLEPYGNSFPEPRIFIKSFNINGVKSLNNKCNSFYVGSKGETLRLVNDDNLVAVGFKAAEKFKSMGEPSSIGLIGVPKINEYNGYVNTQFVIEKDYVLKGV